MTTTKMLAATLLAGLLLTTGQTAWAKDKSADATLSEADRFALEMADSACANDDVAELVRAMAISKLVVQRHSAASISVTRDGSASQIGQDHYVFPLATMDYSWVTPDTISAWETQSDAEWTYLDVDFNENQGGQWAVNWVPVRWEGEPEGEDPGDVAVPIGPQGTLLFQPVDGCWQLQDDAVAAP